MMSLMGGASHLVVAVRLSVSRLDAKAWWAAWERRADQRCTSPETVAAWACTGADRAHALASSRMKVAISLLILGLELGGVSCKNRLHVKTAVRNFFCA